jgi:hypothetical protein
VGGGGGAGGSPFNCCAGNGDCANGDECVEGQCKAAPVASSCWLDADCGTDAVCIGASVCSCGNVNCDPSNDQLGNCVATTANCCNIDANCAQGTECANNVCVTKVPYPACWRDVDCGSKDLDCVGAVICPCGTTCVNPDSPGTCL